VTTTERATVTVTIDGKQVEAEPGALLIKVAQEHGVYIPRFCWHERMKPVGMCRMCLVEVEGVRGYPPACTTPVADGMVCSTQTAAVKQIQDSLLEFLLINHPLDCPVCDRGGECPLQDQTLAFGPGESRFVEEKRHWEKPIPLSNLVLLDRERCIQCARCTRFADEIAGDPLIDFVDRSERTQVLNFEEQPFDSYFSGNTVQICPVGALTATQYRFRARPWDLATAETSCTTCAVHCRGALQSSSNRLVRLLGVDSEPVNHGWLCDKGRYGIEWVHSTDRVLEPMMKRGSELVETSWPEAFDAAAGEIRRVLDQHGPEAIAVIGGAHGTNEGAYAWAKLAKGVIGTDNVDAQLGDGLPAEVVLGLPRAEIADCDRAAAIVLLGPDLREELPVLFLRIKRAALELGVPLVDFAAVGHGLTQYSSHVHRVLPGAPFGSEQLDVVAQARGDRPGPVVVVLGRASLAEEPRGVTTAAAALAAAGEVLFLTALRRANVLGALGAGLAPGFLPGHVTLDAARDWFTGHWGRVPSGRGLDATEILRAAAGGKIQVLVLLGADPMCDFPDAELARRALDGAGYVIAVDAFVSRSTQRAEVFLPCTLWGEQTGTVTNVEHRVQRVGRKVAPEGTAMDDWRIASELAYRLGTDFDLATVDEVADEMAQVAPAQLGATSSLLERVRDGVVLPLREHLDELVVRTRDLTIMAEDGPSISWDPIKVEGEAATASTADESVPADGSEATATEAAPADDASDGADTTEAVDTAHSASAEAAAVAPELYVWDLQVAETNVPARDAYALRLVVGRKLYDRGRVVAETPVFAPLAPDPALRINGHDLAALGVESGTLVKITGARGSLEHPVVADDAVPAGVAYMPFLADGTGPAQLIDVDAPVTDLRVETRR
jgi:NADH-quinone oxidoreductase subunit G